MMLMKHVYDTETCPISISMHLLLENASITKPCEALVGAPEPTEDPIVRSPSIADILDILDAGD